jgi:PAS domain S-box-containing protein
MVIALAVLALLWRSRPHSILDLWLMVVLTAYCFEIGLVAVFNAGRWDIGCYAGRVYALIASSVVLVMLLVEHVRLLGEVVQARGEAVARAAQRESEERLRTMMDAMPQLACFARADGFIEWFNRRWYEYTGTSPETAQGWGWQSVHDPAVLPVVLEAWRRSLREGHALELVFLLRGAEGRYRRFLTHVVPMRDADGRILHWFGTNTDVTEQVEAQDALREADRRKDEFLAMLSHELRNPLAPSVNAVRLLEAGRAGLKPLAARAVDMISPGRRGRCAAWSTTCSR